MAPLKILISGAGVAGNALAFWLAKFDQLFDVTIVERYSTLRTTGLQIDLRGYGIEAIRCMGLEAAVREVCVQEQGIELVDAKGKQWGYWPANKSGKGAQAFTSEFEIMRGDLCQIFHDGTKDKVNYKFGTSITSYTEINGESGPLQVEFADGTSEKYDLVVGADGLYSRTRKLMLESDAPDPLRTLDQYIGYLRVPIPMEVGEQYNASAYIGSEGRFMMTRRHNAEQLQVYLGGHNLTKRLRDVPAGDVTAQKEAFASEFRGAGWKSEEIVELLLKSDDFYCQHEAFVDLDSWSRGHVTLLGDAGFCVSTNGYGTTCAIVGAYVLAGELVRHIGNTDVSGPSRDQAIQSALKAYEQKLRPFVTLLQRGLKKDAESGGGFQLKNWHIPIVYWVVWFACIFRLYKLGAFFFDRGLHEWEMPSYPELLEGSSEKEEMASRRT